MMQLLVNGQQTECADSATLADLLAQMAIPSGGTAVARNDAVVRKNVYAETVLQPGDRIEIIRAVAGG